MGYFFVDKLCLLYCLHCILIVYQFAHSIFIMNILKYLSSITLFIILIVPLGAYAATVPVTTKGDQKSVVVATVNMYDAQIVSQKDSTLSISFVLANRVGIQTGVKYSVELVSKTNKGYIVIDRKIYDETLTLQENSTISKQIEYTAPATVDGTYTVRVTSSTTNGLPLAGAILSDATFHTTVSGIHIVPETCMIKAIPVVSPQVPSKETTLSQIAVFANNQKLQLNCTVMSSLDSALTVTPYFQTTYRTAYGDQIKAVGGDTSPIAFAPHEKKTVSLVLPKPGKPQTYNVGFVLAANSVVSNTVVAQYTLLGTSASVDNLTLDKDFYANGSTATASVLWQSTLRTLPFAIGATLTDDRGVSCAAPVSTNATLKDLNPIVPLTFKVTHSCFNPHVNVTITNSKGLVLDTKDFSFMTTSTTRPLPVWPFIAGLIGIVIISGAVIILKKKHTIVVHTNNETK